MRSRLLQIHLWRDELAEIAEQHKLHGGGKGADVDDSPAHADRRGLPRAALPPARDGAPFEKTGLAVARGQEGEEAERARVTLTADEKLDILISTVAGLQAQVEDLRTHVSRLESLVEQGHGPSNKTAGAAKCSS